MGQEGEGIDFEFFCIKANNCCQPIRSNALFLYHLKTSENRKVFCFQGVKKGCTGNEWV